MIASRPDVNRNTTEALQKYADMVRRICFLYLRDGTDVDDIFQEVFLKLMQKKDPFESDEHEKAWLIRVATNQCKDTLKSFWRKKVDLIENIELPFEDPAEKELLQLVLALPQKYKDVIYLHYYEGYTIPQIATILERNDNTVYSHLHRAKAIMKEKLGGKPNDYSF